MSSSSFPKILPKTSLHSHSPSSSSSSICKSNFIWRFPPKKFDSLPSCISKRSFTSNIQPLNINDELMKRQELAILIYDLGRLLAFSPVSFICIDFLCYTHFNNVSKK
ncbi:unnamed protein product [Rotaria socialis]|nr:unnamed protein product [Rotaria socialis]